ncbi:probable (S)-N-methylcoclaurine 3'-hydroxylase isozyme 2 [Cornus florida]|uniref:probable (S)-N-methylcoclaurine 3'-hydroxylase isozyme 2 n=1 Tax=Cornus florida TaxID=4283 RepID=UPI0028977CDD|nr:probable (S)-N-methylcoclaurine 3'-hydroxylase isozyme 2 [Cornus florida]
MSILTTLATRDDQINLFFPLILLSFLIFIIFKKHISPKAPPLPPGPYAWPIIGNIIQMGDNAHVTLAKLAQLHGPLMSLRFGAQHIVVGSSPEAAKGILKINDRLLSGRYVSNPLRVKGSKIHNLNLGFYDECDGGWKSLRAIYRTEVFSAKVMESQEELREKKVTEMVEYLGSKEGQVVKVKEMVFACALNILSNAFLSMDFMDFEGKGVGEGMYQNIRSYSQMGAVPQLSDFFPILGGWDFQSFYKKLMTIYDRICGVWVDTVKERRQRRDGSSTRRDFTDALIGIGFSDEQINPLLVELFGAGTESTSATTEWALTELIRNQEAMEKVRNELAEVIGSGTVTESNLCHLPYLEACVKETLRLHPPGPLLLPHRATQTCEVMGYTIPKDSQVLVNVWAIARDPAIWDDPLSFKPERFLKSGLDYMGINFEYLPFGSGRRMCPGQPLVSRVVPLILASLVHHFDWILPGNVKPSEIDMNDNLDVTMLKKEPMRVIPRIRKQLKTDQHF